MPFSERIFETPIGYTNPAGMEDGSTDTTQGVNIRNNFRWLTETAQQEHRNHHHRIALRDDIRRTRFLAHTQGLIDDEHYEALRLLNISPPWMAAAPTVVLGQTQDDQMDAGAGDAMVDPVDHLTEEERKHVEDLRKIETATDTLLGNGNKAPRIRIPEGAVLCDYEMLKQPDGIRCHFAAHPMLVAWLRRLAIECQKDRHTDRTVRDLRDREYPIKILDGKGRRVWEINQSAIVPRTQRPNLRLDNRSKITQLGWLRLTAEGNERTIKFTGLDDPAYWYTPTLVKDLQTGDLHQETRLQYFMNRAFAQLASAFIEVPNVVSSRIRIGTRKDG